MINRMRIGRRAPILLLMALAVVATIALADVIFVYNGQISVNPMTTAPLVFSTGPNAGPTNTNAEPYINFTGNNGGFTVSLVITNSYAVYYYEAGQLTVNTAGSIYINSITTSGSAVNTMTIYIAPTSNPNTYICTLTISGSSPAPTPTTPCSLTTGTYYIHIKVVPNTPVTGTSTETVTVNFGYIVVGSTAVPVP
jgi:hypothetical protein